MVKKLALKGLLGVGICGGAAYTTLQFKDRIDKYAGNLFNKKNLRERAGFNCSDDGICTLSSKAKITIRQVGSTDREITGASLNAGPGKIRVYSGDEHSKYNESFKFVIEEGDIDLGGTGITKLEEFETYELKEEDSDGNNPNVKKYVFERKTKASDEIKLALGLPEGSECELPTSNAEKTCALNETKFKKIKFEGKGSDNISGFPASQNLNLKISKVSDEGYPLGLKFVFESEENITVPGSGGSQIILNKNRGFAVKKSRGPKGVTLSLERAWSTEKILAKVGLSGCLTNGSDCTLGKLNIKQGESDVATGKTATPTAGAKIKLYTGDSAKTYSENLKFVVEGGDINLSDGQGTISKLEELETYEITSQSGTYYLTRKGTRDEAIKSSLGLEDGCSLPSSAGTNTSCSIDLTKLKKINFENKASDDGSLTLSNPINLKITKVSDSDFPLGLKFVFESATDINVPAQSGITITLNSKTEYKIKRKEEGKVSLERAWDVNTLLEKVGLKTCTTDNSECTISNLKVKKDTHSETGKSRSDSTPSKAKIVLSTSSAGYKEGLKFSIEGGDITLSGGGQQITKLEEFETYQIEGSDENYYLTRKEKAGDVILKTLGLTPSDSCKLPDKDNEPKTCSLDTAALKAINFEDKSSGNDSLAVSNGSLPLKIHKVSNKDDFPLGYKFVFESESEINVNTNSGDPLKLSKYIDYKIKKKDKNSLSLERAWTVDALIKKVGLTTCVNATADGSECTLGQLNINQGHDKKETSKSISASPTGKIKLYNDSSYQEGLKFSIEKGDIDIENGTNVSKLEEFETYEIKEEQGKYYLTRKTEAKEEIKKALGIDGLSCELPTDSSKESSCNNLTDANLKKIKFDGVTGDPAISGTNNPTLKITKTNDTESFPLGYKFVFETSKDITIPSTTTGTNITLNSNTEFKLKKGEKNTLSLEKAWTTESLIKKIGLSGCTNADENGTDCSIVATGLSVNQGTDKKATGKKEQTEQTAGKIKLYSDSSYKEGLKFSIETGDITLQNGTGSEQVTKLEEFETYEIKDDGGVYYLTRKDEAKDVIKKALGLTDSSCELPPTEGGGEKSCSLDSGKLKALNFKDKSSDGEPSGGTIPVNLKISKVADKTDFPLGLRFVFESENDITVPGNGSTQIKLNKYTDYKLKKEDKNALSLEKAWDLGSLIKKVGLKDCTATEQECKIEETGDSGLSVKQSDEAKSTKKKKQEGQSTGKIKVFTDNSTGYREGFRFEVVDGDITLQNGEGSVSKLEEMESYEIAEDGDKYYLTRKTEAKKAIKKLLGLDGISECELPTENGKTTECCILSQEDLKKIKFDGISGDQSVEDFSNSLTLTITKTSDKSFPLGLKFVFGSETDVTVKGASGSTEVKLNKNTEFKIKRGNDNSSLTLEKAWNLSSLIAKVGLKGCTENKQDCTIDEADDKGLNVKHEDGKTATGKKKKSGQTGTQGKIKVFTDNATGYKEGLRFEVVGGDITLQNGTGDSISKLEEMESYEITEHQGTYYLSRKTEAKAAIKKALGLDGIEGCELPTGSSGDSKCCNLTQDNLKNIKFDGKASDPTITGLESAGTKNLKITKTDDTTNFPLGLKFVFEFESDVTVSKQSSNDNIKLNKQTDFRIKRGNDNNDISLEKAWNLSTLIAKVGLKTCTNAETTNGTECDINDEGSGLNVDQGNSNKATGKKKKTEEGTSQGKIKVYQDDKYNEGFRFVIEEGDISLQNGADTNVSKLEQFETYEIKDEQGTYYLTRKSEAREGIKKALGLDEINNCNLPTGTEGDSSQCCNLGQEQLKKIKFDGKAATNPTVTGLESSSTTTLKITKVKDENDFPFGYKFVFESEGDVTINKNGSSDDKITLNKETEFKIKKTANSNEITLTKAWTVESLTKKVGLKDCNSADANGTDCTIDSSGLSVSQGGSKKATGKKEQTGQTGSQGKIKVYGGDKGKGFKEGLKFEVVGGDITFQNGDSSEVTKLEQFETYEIKEESNTYYLTRKDEAKDGIKKALGLDGISGCDLPDAVGADEKCCNIDEAKLKKIKFSNKSSTDETITGLNSSTTLKISKVTDTTTYPFGYKFVFDSEDDIKLKDNSSGDIILNNNISYKIKKTENSNEITLEKLEVSKLLEKIGLTGCDNITNGKGTECQIKSESEGALNVKQGQNKEEKKKQKTDSGSKGKIKVYGGDEAKGYSERLKFVIEEGDIEIEGSQVTKLEEFETYEITEESGTYYLTRKDKASSIKKKLLGLPDKCTMPEGGSQEEVCCELGEDDIKKIKFDGLGEGQEASINKDSDGETTLSLKISISPTGETNKDDFPLGYKFTLISNKEITLGGSNKKIAKNTNTEFKIKKTGSGKETKLSLEKAWTIETLGKKVGLKCPANGAGTEGTSEKECTFTDGEINVHNGTDESKIEKAKLKAEDASSKKIKYEEDQDGYNQGFRFYSENEDICLEKNEDSESSGDNKKIEKKGDDSSSPVYYEIKKDNETWYLYKKSSSTGEQQ